METYSVRWLDPRRPTETEVTGTFAYDLNNQGVAIGWAYSDPPLPNIASPPPAENYVKGPIVWYPDRTEFDGFYSFPTSLNDGEDFAEYRNVGIGGHFENLREKFQLYEVYMPSINNRGVVTGNYRTNPYSGSRAFIYNARTGGPPTDFDLLRDGSNAFGWAINEKDHVLGYRSQAWDIRHPEERAVGSYGRNKSGTFLSVDGEVIELGDVFGSSLNDYDVVVGSRKIDDARETDPTAFRLDTAAAALEFEDLGALPDLGHDTSFASDINNSGDIVGSSWQGAQYTSGYDSHAFIVKNEGTMHDLNALIPAGSGWTLRHAVRINEQGEILCWGHAVPPAVPKNTASNLCCVLSPEIQIPFAKPPLQMGDRHSLRGGSGWVVFWPGGRPVPINPNELLTDRAWKQLPPETRDIALGQAINSLGVQISELEGLIKRATAQRDR